MDLVVSPEDSTLCEYKHGKVGERGGGNDQKKS